MFGRGRAYRGNQISPMQFAMLLILRKRSMYGYEVLKEMRDRFDPVWVPKTGSIYPALKRLEEHGLVRSEKVDGTDHYIISDEGRTWVEEELQRSPKDIRLITRYLELLDQAATEVMPAEKAEARRSGRFREIFEEDDPDRSRRVKKLREARKRIAEHLANVDRELAELEDADGEQGGKSQ